MSINAESADSKKIKDTWVIALVSILAAMAFVGFTSLYDYASKEVSERVATIYNVEVVKYIDGREPSKIIIREGSVTKECFTPTNEQMDSRTPLLCSVLETLQSK